MGASTGQCFRCTTVLTMMVSSGRQHQMEENKRLAREERLQEMKEAAERRKEQEALLGLKGSDEE